MKGVLMRHLRVFAKLLLATTLALSFGTQKLKAQDNVSLRSRIAELEQRIARIEQRLNLSGRDAATRSTPQPAPLPLQATLFNKKIVQPEGNGSTKHFAFLIELKNISAKDINSYQGDMTISRRGGDDLLTFSASITDYVASGDSLVWYGGIPYESDEANHQSVLRADIHSLKITLEPEQIFFTDGSVTTFDRH